MNIGSHTLNMIKKLFVTENRTGCRFITVDAYNNEEVLQFYQKNEFQFFYDKDEDKKNPFHVLRPETACVGLNHKA